MGFLKLFGRVLIVIAIVSSAYLHLNAPEKSVQEFQANYSTLDNLSQKYLSYDLPLDHVPDTPRRPTGDWQSRSSAFLKCWWCC
jgi:hypothetical protein